MSTPVLAIDIGGTKVAAALVSESGEILRESQVLTQAFLDGVPRDGDAIYADVDSMVRELLDHGTLFDGVGVGSAGPIDIREGSISPVNIPGWRRYPIIDRLAATLADLGHATRPVLIGDGHCVALGEQWLGAGRDFDEIVGVICSTGVGAGVVTRHEAYQGRTGNAVHLGHVTVKLDGRRCVCGGRGCVEAYASGTSMTMIARERGWQGQDAIALVASAQSGDTTALTVIDEGMRALAAGLAMTCTMFDVPTVVVGGGVSKAGETIFVPLRRHFADYCRLGYVADEAQILQAVLPNAGLLGAAMAGLGSR